MVSKTHGRLPMVWAALLCSVLPCGCAGPSPARTSQLQAVPLPRELDKVNLPDYIVEPPDILLIQATHTLRTPDFKLSVGDRLQVKLKNGLPIEVDSEAAASPAQFEAELKIELEFKIVSGTYRIESDGSVDFGPSYGKVKVAGLTLAQAESAIRRYLEDKVQLKAPELSVELDDLESPQPVTGEHLVRPDGRVSLGVYGDIYVAGMSLAEVRNAVTQHMVLNGIQDPKVWVDVALYNSKNFYVISDGGGYGEQLVRLPCTGNETVLDAIAQINGLADVSSKHIWIARPSPSTTCEAQILEVDWEEITALGRTDTNYQLLPGDRIYIQADKLMAFNNVLDKLATPVERIFSVGILGFNFLRNSKGVYAIKSTGTGGGPG